MFSTKIEQNDEGEQIIELPYDIIDKLGWNEHVVLKMEIVDGSIKLTRKTEWTVEELSDNDVFDSVITDVVENRQTHFIFHDGHKYALLPYETYEKTDEEIIS